MQWVRSNIGLGTRTAFFALLVQFALSFGHIHAVTTQTASQIASTHQQLPPQSPEQDQHQDDFCAICAVVAMAGTAMAAAPPALPVRHAFELTQPAVETAFEHPRFARTAFQSRAPPLS
jgi:hypothetical protein